MFTENDFKGVWNLITVLVWAGVVAIGAVLLGGVGLVIWLVVRALS